MKSNTAEYNQAIIKVTNMIALASATGMCVVCRRKPRAIWKDTGELRMTCGDPKCFIEWLPVSKDANRAD